MGVFVPLNFSNSATAKYFTKVMLQLKLLIEDGTTTNLNSHHTSITVQLIAV